jgi:replicative DNA helicase
MSLSALDSEQAVIGAALYDPDTCDIALERLRPDMFFEPYHVAAWERIGLSRRTGSPADALVVTQTLAGHPAAQAYGPTYFHDMVEKAVLWSVSSHIDTIADRAVRRSVQTLAKDVSARCDHVLDGSGDLLLAELERGAADVARASGSASLAVPAGLDAMEMLEAAWRGDNRGVPIGLECLDRVTSGIRQEDVWVIGARTSMGKSVFGLNLARAISQQGRGSMIFSLEMPRREVQARLICDLAFERKRAGFDCPSPNVRYSDILQGRSIRDQRQLANDGARALASLPMVICDAGGLTIDDIRVQALRQMRAWDRAGVARGCVLIDHIGLVRPVKKGDSKAADTADIVNELKSLAKAIRAPIIVLSQVNRGPEGRQDKRPTAADLNWSGAIEQIADMICLLYRESYYLERSADRADRDSAVFVENKLELLIQKNRSGPTCNLEAWIDVACNAVRDVSENHTDDRSRSG